MSIKRFEGLGSFWAASEEGEQFEIFEFREILDAATFDDPNGEVRGLRCLRTVDGRPVNCDGDKRFEIVGVPMIRLERTPYSQTSKLGNGNG